MKRVLSLILVLGMVLTCFTGCAKKEKRALYNVDLEKYVELGEYKGIKIDKNSDEFKTTYQGVISSDVSNYGLYNTKKSGKVKNGDNVNIDYEGKKDGVAFEGGTAKAYNLLIGSGSFISGFEDGLIGKEIGSTVDLNLTFPEDYNSEELKGQKVVFTVKINYVTTEDAKDPKDYYMSLNFNSVDEYYENVEKRAIEQSLQNAVIENSEIIDYPEEDLDFLYDIQYKYYDEYIYSQTQKNLDEYLESAGQSLDEFKKSVITNEVKPTMQSQMFCYAIFDNEDMKITEKERDNGIKEIIKLSGDSSMTRADVVEKYGEYFVESYIVTNKVFDFLEKNAKIS